MARKYKKRHRSKVPKTIVCLRGRKPKARPSVKRRIRGHPFHCIVGPRRRKGSTARLGKKFASFWSSV